MTKYYWLINLGCQANIRDGEQIDDVLQKNGYLHSKGPNQADIIIFNTCSVRKKAEDKVFSQIGFYKKLKKIVGVCGCMGHNPLVVKKLTKNFHINFIIGTSTINELPKAISQNLATNKPSVIIKDPTIREHPSMERVKQLKAFVNIAYGCNHKCSYCIVPSTRGNLVSRPSEDIIKEILGLKKSGCQEVTLIAQNVNDYGIDLKNELTFPQLLDKVAKTTKIPRIRFVTSNPWNLNIEMVDVVKNNKNIMPYFHLPIQSGDKEILKQMYRGDNIDKYKKTIEYIRKNIPFSAITTDIIVGFPNESNKQFQHTLDLYNEIKFDNAYTFIYSKRDNTVAANIVDKITEKQKRLRLQKLNELVKKYAKENNNKYVGQQVEVLIEGKSKTNKNIYFGYSPQWKVVNITGKCQVGKIIKVVITSASRFSLNAKTI